MANKTVYPFGAGGQLPSSIGIVNDLTTGGADKALSAEMGKELGNKVNPIVEGEQSANIFDSSAAVSGWINSPDGVVKSATGYHVSDFIEIPQGAIKVKTTSQILTGNQGWACYNSSKVYTHGLNQSSDITFQDGDAYFRFTIENDKLDTTMAVVGNVLPDTYIPYGLIYHTKSADDLFTDSNKMPLSAAQGAFIAENTMRLVESVNILDPAIISLGKYVDIRDGVVRDTTAGYGCTDFMNLPYGGLSCNSVFKTEGATTVGVIGYAADKATILGYVSASYHGGSVFVEKTGTVNSTWEYVRFNICKRTDGEYMVVKGGQLPSVYVSYSPPYYDGLRTDGFISTQPTSANILNPANIMPNTLAKLTGGFISYTDVYCTNYIAIDERGLYCNHTYNRYGSYYVNACVYDANKDLIRYETAGPKGVGIGVSYQEGDAFVIFNIPSEYSTNEVYVCRGVQPLPNGYEAYTEHDAIKPDLLNMSDLPKKEAERIVNNAGVYPSDVDVVLPNRFYAVVGDTLQLFYQGLVIAPLFKQYDIFASSTVGKGLGRYFEFTPAAAGTSTLSMQVFDQNMKPCGSGTCEIKAVSQPSNPSSNKNVLCIGDSLTAGGYWVCELQRRLKASDGTPQGLGLTNITLVGSNTSTKYGQTAHHYGNSGWGWQDFCTAGRAAFRFHVASADNVSLGNVYTNNGYAYTIIEINNIGTGGTDDWTILCSTSATTNTPQSSGTLTLQTGTGGNLTFTSAEADGANLLWDSTNERINFKKYCTTNAGMSSSDNLDYLLILLTWNGLPVSEDPSSWSTIIGYIEDMLDAIHTDYPTCKVKLMCVQFPYIDNYVSAVNPQHTFAVIRRVAFMNKLYQSICDDDAYSSYVEFVNISGQFDSQYNYPFTAKPVNTRNSSVTENYVNNSVHPGETGYLQIADAAYRAMCAALNE